MPLSDDPREPRLSDELVDAAIEQAGLGPFEQLLADLADQLGAAAAEASRRGLYGLAESLTDARDSARSWATSS